MGGGKEKKIQSPIEVLNRNGENKGRDNSPRQKKKGKHDEARKREETLSLRKPGRDQGSLKGRKGQNQPGENRPEKGRERSQAPNVSEKPIGEKRRIA